MNPSIVAEGGGGGALWVGAGGFGAAKAIKIPKRYIKAI